MLGKVDHRIVTTDAHEIDNLSRSAIHRNFATFDGVVGGDMAPRDVGVLHHIGHVDRVRCVQFGVLGCATRGNGDVPLDAVAALERNLLALENHRKSDVLLKVVRNVSPLHSTKIALGRLDHVCNVICLKIGHLNASYCLLRARHAITHQRCHVCNCLFTTGNRALAVVCRTGDQLRLTLLDL